ncbi:copper chaperone PCu(A)C [Leucobacter salsicius]|uniref:copper chaperone PCu(A)C n=1 Tax=Leucobacter salsicius TaxID=664638 RepID=UPI000346A286|nr:copper chaperone PCu(A)C [Leucobacter salsicius]
MNIFTHNNSARFSRSARNVAATAGILLAAPLLLTACSSAPSAPAAAEQSSQQHHGEAGVHLMDGWAKAGEIDGMTGFFGTISNPGDTDLTITGLSSDAAGVAELHEVTSAGVMQQIEGDVVVPAGGSFELAPGANHIMLMELNQNLLAGDEVTVTVSFNDGSSVDLTALVKDYSGANEDYGDISHEGHDAEADTGGTESHDGGH